MSTEIIYLNNLVSADFVHKKVMTESADDLPAQQYTTESQQLAKMNEQPNIHELPDFQQFREAVRKTVILRTLEQVNDEEMAVLYRQELWLIKNNFSPDQWQDVQRLAAKRIGQTLKTA